uniref:Uncharacterized protein n=1 Tax=Anguilla anguilla TaxID=7936 RepID=A0A0E9QHA6_ANGAN
MSVNCWLEFSLGLDARDFLMTLGADV